MLEEILKSLLPELKEIARAQTVIGDPIQAGESTVIPVSKVSVGFGAGGSSESKPGGIGTGGGAMIEPIAFIVITEGRVQLVPVTSKDTTIGKVIDMVPDILDRVGFRDKKETKQTSGEEETENQGDIPEEEEDQ